MLERRTKIVATLGPATDAPGVLDRLVAAGMDCARLNCSHGDADALKRRAAEVRDAAQRCGRPLGLLFDLQGPKLRLNGDTAEQVMQTGDTITFSEDGPGPGRVIVDFVGFSRLVTERSQVVIGDGVPRFAVEAIRPGEVDCRTISPGRLAPRKGINVTHARPELPAITEKDAIDLELAVELEADFVALSFVRSAQDIEELATRLKDLGSRARTIAKIEKIEAYERLDEIVKVANGVMVARGDFGVEAGVARVPLMQKDTIFRATQAGKLVITATQMLESMIQAPEPTRAEATDVANAVIDGTSAVMLSAETSVGSYPVEAVTTMAEIAEAAEASPVIHGRARERRARIGRRRRHARRRQPRGRDRRRRARRPDLDRRRAPRGLEVPPAAADHRARPRDAGGKPAHAGVGRLPDHDGDRRHRRRHDRHGARDGARLRRDSRAAPTSC